MLIPASIGLVAEQTNVRTGLAVLIASYGAIAVIVRSVLPHPYQHSSKDG
jgi:hypothetical protein